MPTDESTGVPIDDPSAENIAACNALGSLTFDAETIALPTLGASVDSSEMQPASELNPAGEHCLVKGVIASVDSDAQGIQFALALPSDWNVKTIHAGGGGWDGATTNPSTLDVATGYAVFGSDGGYQSLEGDASIGLNAEQLQNFGGDQLKKTRDVAMQLIEARYAETPMQNYFVGGSNGGRESFAVMQQWPEDYDGIVTLFPAFSWTGLFMKLQEIGRSMRADDGAGWFGADKATLLREAALDACDSLDGLEDGLISNREACTFDPTVLQREASEDMEFCTCLSEKPQARR